MRTLCSALLLCSLISISAQLTQAKPGTGGREFVIAEVTRLGGTVEFDNQAASLPIIKIDLHGTKVRDSDLVFLEKSKKDLRQLAYLDLRLTKIGDAALAYIQNLKSLQTLNLFRTEVGDRGLARLKRLSELRTLLIGGTKVSDAGLIYLKPFKKLQKLSLFQTQVSDGGIDQLQLMGSLKVLLISGSKITPAGTEKLQKAMPRVRFSEST